ncbi:MAG: 23S rRNA (uracil(1939)-C(5))-methyltransferase RlmD [Erysipelothrix sp.]|nr:23S rRNA (uracil(1939)-C(5))-methyltransferase RlmD [Erysipelothrix sp.]
MGFGVLKPNNFTVFAKGLIIGEKADLKIEKLSKNFAIASVLNIINKSVDRREVTMPNTKAINAYKYLHINYPAQIKLKEKQLYDLFGYKIKVLASDQEFHYRNKSSFTISNGKYNMYGDNNKLVPVDQCIISHKEINKIMPYVLEAINNNKKAKIKEVIFRYSQHQDALMIIFVSEIDNYFANKIAQEIVGYSSKVKSVILNMGTSNNYLFNETEKTLYGDDYIIDRIFNKLFKITSKSFYQVNNYQTEKLYQTILDFGKFTLEDNILDLYCGVGSIALTLSDYVNHILGVEILKEAVDSARENIELNDIHNVDIIRQDLNDNLSIEDNIDCIIVDPPRSGLSQNIIKNISNSKVNKLIYVSCNPTTQKRDIDLFIKAGYKLSKQQAVDMFSNTEHIESVALLEK